jgi:hypothetical protein
MGFVAVDGGGALVNTGPVLTKRLGKGPSRVPATGDVGLQAVRCVAPCGGNGRYVDSCTSVQSHGGRGQGGLGRVLQVAGLSVWSGKE